MYVIIFAVDYLLNKVEINLENNIFLKKIILQNPNNNLKLKNIFKRLQFY